MIEFLWGSLAALSAVAALFFLKYWRRTRDYLFMSFTLGFATLSLHWLALAVIHPPSESRHYLFFVRLLAFLFILTGVVVKNASSARTNGVPPPSARR